MSERKNLLLRLDPAVYDAIAKWAADDLRSVNAQIEYVLRRALRTAGRAASTAEGADAAAERSGRSADGPGSEPAGGPTA
jgi:hypothetical protein